MEVFPDIFNMARLKYGTVAEHLNRLDETRNWNLHLRCHLNDYEIPQVTALIELL